MVRETEQIVKTTPSIKHQPMLEKMSPKLFGKLLKVTRHEKGEKRAEKFCLMQYSVMEDSLYNLCYKFGENEVAFIPTEIKTAEGQNSHKVNPKFP